MLDYSDAVAQIVSSTYLPTMSALVGSAIELLGGVLRDPRKVLHWLQRSRRGDTATRHGLAVALAMLWWRVPVELAWPDPADPEGANVYFAALALGEREGSERLRLARAAEGRARGAAIEVAELALARLESGARLSVID